jgi:hypothetical protein
LKRKGIEKKLQSFHLSAAPTGPKFDVPLLPPREPSASDSNWETMAKIAEHLIKL